MLASMGARSIPDNFDFWWIWHPFIADQRGDGLSCLSDDSYQSALMQRMAETKSHRERRARELHVSDEDLVVDPGTSHTCWSRTTH